MPTFRWFLLLPDALSALWACVASQDDELLIVNWQDGTRRETSYFNSHDSERFEAMIRFHTVQGHDPRVSLSPRRDKHLDNLAPSTVMWASIENPTSVRGLQAFAPRPTLLFKTGRSLRAIWWLDRPLPMRANPSDDYLTKGNKRLAYALKANSRHADPSWLMPIGELIDADPDRRYAAADVVGRGRWRNGQELRDAPIRRMRPVAA